MFNKKKFKQQPQKVSDISSASTSSKLPSSEKPEFDRFGRAANKAANDEAVAMFEQAEKQMQVRRSLSYGKMGGVAKAIGVRVRVSAAKTTVAVSGAKGLYDF